MRTKQEETSLDNPSNVVGKIGTVSDSNLKGFDKKS